MRCVWQTATLGFAQRMLWKREQNIFPDRRSQVHQIILDRDGLFPGERQIANPIGKIQDGVEGF